MPTVKANTSPRRDRPAEVVMPFFRHNRELLVKCSCVSRIRTCETELADHLSKYALAL